MTELTADSILVRARALKLVCIGDIMLDRFVYGQIDRVSPEAPVPILQEARRSAMPGGAANVARNLASLGVEVSLIGAVGNDAEGKEVTQLIGNIERISSSLVSLQDRPTTLKTRFVAGGQQVIRVDVEETTKIDANAEAQIVAALSEDASSAHAIVLSDYAKGILTNNVIEAAVAAAQAHNIPIIVDPKGKDFQRYGPVDVIKPNANELSVAAELPVDTDADVDVALSRALELSEAKAIIVTRAAIGMSYAKRGTPVEHVRGKARDVYDVSGAGDTSLAALAVGIAVGAGLDASVKLAIAASGIAVGKSGTAAVSAEEVQATLQAGHISGTISYTLLPDLVMQVAAWRDAGQIIGFTNGCFDLLHPGHLRVLEDCLLYTSPSPRDATLSRMPSSA